MKATLFLASLLLMLGVFGAFRIAKAHTEAPAKPISQYVSTTFSGSIPVDGGLTLRCVGFLSAPLFDFATRTHVRVVVITENFEVGSKTLSRVCLYKMVNPESAEGISSTYSVGRVIRDGGPLPQFLVEVVPMAGYTWETVEEFEHLQVTVVQTE